MFLRSENCGAEFLSIFKTAIEIFLIRKGIKGYGERVGNELKLDVG